LRFIIKDLQLSSKPADWTTLEEGQILKASPLAQGPWRLLQLLRRNEKLGRMLRLEKSWRDIMPKSGRQQLFFFIADGVFEEEKVSFLKLGHTHPFS